MAPLGGITSELLKTTPSVWATETRWIRNRELERNQPYSFDGRPFLIDIHDNPANSKVIMKGAQVGATEAAFNLELHCLLAIGDNALHVMPQREILRTLVQARIDPIFQLSPTLRKVPQHTSNPEHKRIGHNSNWYFRGSNSPQTIHEFAVRMVVLDEFDELNPLAPPLALERMSGIREDLRRLVKLSTPTHAGRGIDNEYTRSSRGKFHVPCPHCREYQDLTFGQNGNLEPVDDLEAIGDRPWRCRKCGDSWTEAQRRRAVNAGEWHHENPNHPVVGYHISQLYSPGATAKGLLTAYVDALKSDRSSILMPRFYNSKLGLPWSASGARITDQDINNAQTSHEGASYQMVAQSSGIVSMGVDIGRDRIHVNVAQWPAIADDAMSRVRKDLAFYVVTEWEDLDPILKRHGVTCCVVDAFPEKREAKKFQARFPDIVWLAYYPDGVRGQLVRWHEWKADHLGTMQGGRVDIERTESLDTLISRFKAPQTIQLPTDLPDEARRHLKSTVRTMGMDRFGNEIPKYDNEGADHFLHAMNYSEIAGLRCSVGEAIEVPQEKPSEMIFSPMEEMGSFQEQEFDRLGNEITGL